MGVDSEDDEASSHGDRMKQERVNLNLTPLQAGKLLKLSARMYLKFEGQWADLPNAYQLMRLAESGFNVQYILTGQRALSLEEQALVENYRASSPQRRVSLREVGTAFAQPGYVDQASGGE